MRTVHSPLTRRLSGLPRESDTKSRALDWHHLLHRFLLLRAPSMVRRPSSPEPVRQRRPFHCDHVLRHDRRPVWMNSSSRISIARELIFLLRPFCCSKGSGAVGTRAWWHSRRQESQRRRSTGRSITRREATAARIRSRSWTL